LSLRRYWALGLLALVMLATAGVRLRLLDIPLDRDEGEYGYVGQLLLQPGIDAVSWMVRPESDKTIFDWFDHYQRRFDRVGVVEILSLRETKYLWGLEAAAYTPRSDFWLAVYERKR
jgi:hypothetical protein